MRSPSRGELWMTDLQPTRGHEQGGIRPALVLSANSFNQGPAGLVIVLPVTKVRKRIPTHVPVPGGEAGLSEESFIKCEDVRSISKDRLIRYMGDVASMRVDRAGALVRLLLGL